MLPRSTVAMSALLLALLAAMVPHVEGKAAKPQFVHPGIIVTKPMLDQIRQDVANKVEPVYTAYKAAKTGRVAINPAANFTGLWLANLSYAPQCQPLVLNGSGWVPFKEDAFAAWTHALLWYIDEDPQHAEKAIELLDGWAEQLMKQSTVPFVNTWGLQTAWGTAVWPRAAEIIKHTYTGWPAAKSGAFGAMLTAKLLPIVEHGASTNGNIGLAMTEASLHIGVFTDNATAVANAVALWRGQAPAYLYVQSDGKTPKRPPLQPYLAGTGPVCTPSCTDKQMVDYWHGQADFTHDGICQESCRDLGHVQLGFATLINSAETAHHQGIDLYGENTHRIVAGAEFHATLYTNEPAALQQKWPSWLCGGKCRGEHCGPVKGGTWEMVKHHYSYRLGTQKLPNVTAMLTFNGTRPTNCWDHMCWETLTHGGKFNVSR